MENKRRVVTEELHKPARRNYPRRKFEMRDIDETWQADLVEMQPYARENQGYRYLLTVIDVFSKFAWAQPVRRKTGQDVTSAMETILKQGRIPTKLHTDNGKEFYNSIFQSLMEKHKIKLYSTYSNLKASIIERFNRTLKTNMWRRFSLNGSFKWLDMLPELIDTYNNTVHRTIKMKPKDVTSRDQIIDRFKSVVKKKKPKFKVGDKVRVSKAKHVFEKGYTPNWTTEIFTVSRVSPTNPVTYHLKDYKNEKIKGGFYEQELLKAKYPDVYLIEKVLQRRGDKVLIKWLGFDKEHNSWINKDDL